MYGPVYREKIVHVNSVIVTDPVEYAKVIHREGRFPVRARIDFIDHYLKIKKHPPGLFQS